MLVSIKFAWLGWGRGEEPILNTAPDEGGGYHCLQHSNAAFLPLPVPDEVKEICRWVFFSLQFLKSGKALDIFKKSFPGLEVEQSYGGKKGMSLILSSGECVGICSYTCITFYYSFTK